MNNQRNAKLPAVFFFFWGVRSLSIYPDGVFTRKKRSLEKKRICKEGIVACGPVRL